MVDRNVVFVGPGEEVFLGFFDGEPDYGGEAEGGEEGEVDFGGLAGAVEVLFDHAKVDGTDEFSLHRTQNPW